MRYGEVRGYYESALLDDQAMPTYFLGALMLPPELRLAALEQAVLRVRQLKSSDLEARAEKIVECLHIALDLDAYARDVVPEGTDRVLVRKWVSALVYRIALGNMVHLAIGLGRNRVLMLKRDLDSSSWYVSVDPGRLKLGQLNTHASLRDFPGFLIEEVA